jgi:hypothetical protein
VLCELVPGGVPGEITAGRAGQILASITPAEAVQAALYRSRTRRRYCELRFGRMSRSHQDRGSWRPSVCCT